ncbi:M4 family metallopeptidase [Streptomyces lavendulae]|uniref:M4 family metallopeptidase n=1 Tax=Streptomyces lavendulae TaxID=1914 RepID=UPI0037F6A7D4
MRTGGPGLRTTRPGFASQTSRTRSLRWHAHGGAFWDASCACVPYGDGTTPGRPPTSLDIVGHELAHGLIGSTASFAATGEPGALGEGTADYAAARTATIQSAIELYGASSAEATRVAAAWKAVNVG